MLKCERAELCRDVLLDEGYRATFDDDGDVVFKAEGLNLIVILDDDETFFRLVMPNIWSIDSPSERANAVRAAHDVTKEIKVAKVFCTENSVWCSAELFFGEADHFKSVINRVIQVVCLSRNRFAEKMRA